MELSIVRRTMCSRVRTSSRVFEVMPVLGAATGRRRGVASQRQIREE